MVSFSINFVTSFNYLGLFFIDKKMFIQLKKNFLPKPERKFLGKKTIEEVK